MTDQHFGDEYDRDRERRANREAEKSRKAREIGELPKVGNKRLKNSCRKNFRKFCERYFPNAFRLAWSADHLRVIERIEQAVLSGGLFALGHAPRQRKNHILRTGCDLGDFVRTSSVCDADLRG